MKGNLRRGFANNTSKIHVCTFCTSFVHSLRLFQWERRTLDNILSGRCQKAALNHVIHLIFVSSPHTSL